MDTKTCTKCGKTKPLTEFRPRKINKDGLDGRCKECVRRIARAYKHVHAEETLARKFLAEAVAKGRIVKPEKCSACGKEAEGHNLHAHHKDYMYAYYVEWLCAKCHGQRPRGERSEYMTTVSERV